jgi:hypothetical protein
MERLYKGYGSRIFSFYQMSNDIFRKKIIPSCGMGRMLILILLADKMPAPQEILEYFFIWKFLTNFL